MKKLIVALLASGIVFASPVLWADDNSLESFYRNCIEKKIENCERKVKHMSSRGENLRKTGEQALLQANFYLENMEELVGTMVEKNIGRRLERVNHFLIKAYTDGVDGVRLSKKATGD